MNESTIQQITLFIISLTVLLNTGKYMIQINGVKTIQDFFIGMISFYTFIFFTNYFLKLTSKFLRMILLIFRQKNIPLNS